MNSAPERYWDHETAFVTALAMCASLASFLVYFRRGDILLYGDAVAHINIARRVFDSRTPGLLQLGTVWLPLPHLLMMPLLVSRWAWQTGVGGSVPSMIAYILGVAGIFRLVRGAPAALAADRSPGLTAWFASAIYGLNPNLLYLQATAMTESLYLALFIWTLVYFGEFLRMRGQGGREAQTRSALWKCRACLAGACLTRYDGWFVAVGLGTVVIWIAATGALARTAALRFVALAAAVPLLWFAYNGIVYRNPVEFANGPYSARAIEQKTVARGFSHPGTNSPPVAAAYFVRAGEFSVAEGRWQPAWLLLAAVGSLYVLLNNRCRSVLLLLWTPIPFYILSVAYGGVPIYTPGWWGSSLYNIRYGVQLLPALAVFLALSVYFAASSSTSVRAKRGIVLLGVGLVALSYASVWQAGPVCYREAWVNSRTRLQLEKRLAEELRRLPVNSTLLMYLGEHVGAFEDAGIPLRRAIHEGNHRVWKQPSDPEGMWERALADPSRYADYVVGFEGDPVWQAVHQRSLPPITAIVVPGQPTATIFRAR